MNLLTALRKQVEANKLLYPTEIPEIEKVVDKAIAISIEKEKAEIVKRSTLPIHKPNAHANTWVEVGVAGENTEAFKIDEESITDEELASGVDEYVAEVDSEVNEHRTSNFGLPPRAKAGLTNPDIELDESQVAAIQKLINSPCGCLIGAAGTGKTTVTKYLVDGLLYNPESGFKAKKTGMRWNIAFVAFTGMATQVMKQNLPEWLHGSVMTVHSLLEFMPQESISIDKTTGKTKITMPFVPQRNESNPLDYDLVIFDEASMLGLSLWDQFRVACKPGTRIYMIGDLNQLPPIIGEPIFAYAMSQWPLAELTHIHRQKGEGANKIIEVAHAILNGKGFEFDKMQGNPNWRVAGGQVSDNALKGHNEIVATIAKLLPVKFADGTHVYDPYRDRVMTAGNGENRENTSCLVQQIPMNEALSLLIRPPSDSNPIYIIDAGRTQKRFAVGHRIMATKNESPSIKDRVTNGMTGVILDIVANTDYSGDARRFGTEAAVRKHMRESFAIATGEKLEAAVTGVPQSNEFNDFDSINFEEAAASLADRLSNAETEDEIESADRNSLASHCVTIEFANGATRTYGTKPSVDSLQLAYASTVAKCQGSQFPTAIIIVHGAVKGQLSREWLYTAVTRAQGHVIIFYTEHGLRTCLEKQKIFGKTLAEKVNRYKEMLEGVSDGMGKIMRKSVVLEVGPDESRYVEQLD